MPIKEKKSVHDFEPPQFHLDSLSKDNNGNATKSVNIVGIPTTATIDANCACGVDGKTQINYSDKICINLSGTKFVTTKDTLMSDERTYFAAMLRMRCPSLHGEEFFIDRDPTHFRYILNYLRGNRLNLDCLGAESLLFLDELLLEAHYFNINGLCESLARRIAEITRCQKEEASDDKDFRLVRCELHEVQDVFHEWVIEKNFEFETIQICGDRCFMVLARRVSRGELALVERLMKT